MDIEHNKKLIESEHRILKKYNIVDRKEIIDKVLMIIKNENYDDITQILRHYRVNVEDVKIEMNNINRSLIYSFYGMMVGDSLGMPHEMKKLDYDNKIFDMSAGGTFNLKIGQWTDDSSMGLCVLDHMLEKEFNDEKLMHLFLAWFFMGYNNTFDLDDWYYRPSIGCGQTINKSFHAYLKSEKLYTLTNPNDSGNGSIMRLAAIAVKYHKDINMAMNIARKQSYVTHSGIEAAECCAYMIFIIINAAYNTYTAKELLDKYSHEFNGNCNSINLLAKSEGEWNWKSKKFHYNEDRVYSNPYYIGSYAMDALCMSLHCIYYTTSFEECALKIASLCGDADSTSAVCLQMAGAIYKEIPEKWLKNVQQWDKDNSIMRKLKYILLRGPCFTTAS